MLRRSRHLVLARFWQLYRICSMVFITWSAFICWYFLLQYVFLVISCFYKFILYSNHETFSFWIKCIVLKPFYIFQLVYCILLRSLINLPCNSFECILSSTVFLLKSSFSIIKFSDVHYLHGEKTFLIIDNRFPQHILILFLPFSQGIQPYS